MSSVSALGQTARAQANRSSNLHGARLLQPRKQWIYRCGQLAFDLLALTTAWHLTITLRLMLNPVMSLGMTQSEIVSSAPPLLGVLVLWTVTSIWMSFRETEIYPARQSAMRLVDTTIVVSILAIVVTFFSREFGARLSRSFVLLFAPASYLSLVVARGVEERLWRVVVNRWKVVEVVAVIGAGDPLRRVINRLRGAGSEPFRISGAILPGDLRDWSETPVPVLGTSHQLAEIINREQLNRVIVINGALDESDTDELSRIARRMGVVFSRTLGESWSDTTFGFTQICGMNLLDCRPLRFTRTQQIVKRVCDVILCSATLAVVSPLMLVMAILIRLTSSGPVLYCSQRVGKGGRYFTFLKFRSMYHDPGARRKIAELNQKSGHLFKVKNDPRVTPIGSFMRRFSIDELPQLINVLRGDMSLLGPRPLPACDLDPDGMSRKFMAWAEMRAQIPPGITGLWQIRGRSELSFEQMMELDMEYVGNWSLMLDAKILLATPVAVVTGRGAY